MDLLTAVNTILPWVEENKVTSIITKHPTVSMILANLDTNRERLLTKSYWFNTEHKRFYLSPEGKAAVPTNVLTMYPDDKSLDYEVRGQFVYDLKNSTFVLPAAFDASIRVDLPFEELPLPAANAVVWRACIDSYVPDYGVDTSVQIMMQREGEALALLEREHLRKMSYSAMRSRPGFNFLNSLRS